MLRLIKAQFLGGNSTSIFDYTQVATQPTPILKDQRQGRFAVCLCHAALVKLP